MLGFCPSFHWTMEHPSVVSVCKIDKSSSCHPGLWRMKERPWMPDSSTPPWKDCQQLEMDFQLHVGLRESLASTVPRNCEHAWELERFCEAGQLDKALHVLLGMNQLGFVPSVQTYDSFLKACVRNKALAVARQVHAHIVMNGLDSNMYLTECVISTLVKCGSLGDAVGAFNRLPQPTVFSWTALISGYTKAGQCQDALRMYGQMQLAGVRPNTYTFASVLRACGNLADLKQGKQIHAQAVSAGCDMDLFVGTALIDMYARCGSMDEATSIFASLPHHDVASWTAMISANVQQQHGEIALELYVQMQRADARPDAWTFASLLKACAIIAVKEDSVLVGKQYIKQKSLCMGKALHAEAARRGLEDNAFLGDTLVHMYAKCGSMEDSEQVFDTLSQYNVVSWAAIIAGYSDQSEKVLEVYAEMQEAGVTPDPRILVSVLKGCENLASKEDSTLFDGQSIKVKALQRGKEMHVEAVEKGYELDLFVGNTLMHMYAACGSIMDAWHVFDRLPEDDVVSWNVMIAAYSQLEQGGNALQLYDHMQKAGMEPDAWTLASLLKACSSLAEFEDFILVGGQSIKQELLGMGKVINAEAVRRGYFSDVFICNALVSLYFTCGSTADAEYVFKNMPQCNVVSWSAMIAGYAQQGQGEKAIKLYAQMQDEGINPDEGAYLCILKACSSMGALDVCVHIHQNISDSGHDAWSCRVTTALLDAYSKCGSMFDAEKLFDALPERDLVSWTALIAGYARQGEHEMSLDCFEKMQQAGIKPSGVTFLSVLHACSHAGMVGRGLDYFESMTRDHGMTPKLEHYACVVDLYGRAGLLTKAEHLVRQMPMRPNLAVWLSLMSACRKHANIDLARRAFEHARLESPTHWSTYLLMSNIYTDAGRWDEAREIEELSKRAGSWKKLAQTRL